VVRYHCAGALAGTCFDRPWRERAPLTVMSSVIETIERAQLRRVPKFDPGDRVKVHFQVIEGSRRRVQVFEGVVIKRQGHGVRETFTVRKQSFGVGVERTFPVHSPKIERIELAARGDVRRAKLYYLRGRVGKRARVRERRYVAAEESVEPGLVHEPQGATDAEGMTAEAAVMEEAAAREEATGGRDDVSAADEGGASAAEEGTGSKEGGVEQEGDGAQTPARAEASAGERPLDGEPVQQSDGSSAASGDSPSDAGDLEGEVLAGDEPA